MDWYLNIIMVISLFRARFNPVIGTCKLLLLLSLHNTYILFLNRIVHYIVGRVGSSNGLGWVDDKN